MKPILEVKNVSKKFIIDHELRSYLSIGDKLQSVFKSKKTKEEFWALRNVSFDVQPGETFGIIGSNGAGKSTLLKIFSKITPPTEGSIITRGRIASLLEVGTGFHPELSGRENIYLNGTILGMRRKEIQLKFDEIVDFSGVEKFLDTPLKRYSSGMQLRLAFAVAAFLEPEILIIDEVLAVGDAEFQRKCIGQMEEVSKSGRTIIFVSHNMAAVKKLCTKGVLLSKGQLEYIGSINTTVDRYSAIYDDIQTTFPIDVKITDTLPGFAHKLVIEDKNGNPFNEFAVGDTWQVRVYVKILRPINSFIIALGMLTSDDISLRTTWSEPQNIEPGDYEFLFTEDKIILGSGNYKLIIGMSSRMLSFQYKENCASLKITESISLENSQIKISKNVGMVLNPLRINCEKTG